MSFSTACRHNQSLVISAVICLLSFGGMFACHLTHAQKQAIISTTAIAAEAATEGSPLPWSQIGLAIGTILGGGAAVDNRRKDTLIKRLKTENANHLELIQSATTANHRDPAGLRT